MKKLIGFPRKFITVDCGAVRTRVENQNGFGPWSGPHFEYRLELNEADGASIVWTGSSHEEAVAAANEWKMPIVDRTRGCQ